MQTHPRRDRWPVREPSTGQAEKEVAGSHDDASRVQVDLIFPPPWPAPSGSSRSGLGWTALARNRPLVSASCTICFMTGPDFEGQASRRRRALLASFLPPGDQTRLIPIAGHAASGTICSRECP
jgi:hypothetical protein